jgi:hypothetical protein
MNGPAPPPSDLAATQTDAPGRRRDGEAPGALSLTVGIVTFNNSAAELADLARSLTRALARLAVSETLADPLNSPRISIDLFNNGVSPVDPAPFGRDAKLTNSSTNLGFGRAHNRLMARAFAGGADFYVALNPDAMPHPDALIELTALARWCEGRALVEGAQFPEELPKEFDPLSLNTPWAAGCCLLVPAAIYEAIGGFDDNLFLYCEDVDLSWRARAAGFAVKHAPAALVSHSFSRPGANPAPRRAHLDAARYLAKKWGDEPFQRRAERETVEAGVTPSPLPASMPAPSGWPHADFGHWLSFAHDRWAYASPIPAHKVTRRAGLDTTIDIIVRFHDPDQVWRLSRCLFSLYGQRHQPIQILVVMQGFDAAGVASVEACIEAFDWTGPRRRPQAINVNVPAAGDHRARLWNAGLDAASARYVGFCDYDDVVYTGGYSFLLHRLQLTNAAAAFGSSLHVDCAPMRGFDYVFAKRPLVGRDRYDFFARNFCPPNSILFDRSIIAAADLRVDESLSKNEDYRTLGVIVAKYETDWASIGTVVADYVHRSDGSNTVLSHGHNPAAAREWEHSDAETRRFLDALSTRVPVGEIARLRESELGLRSELEGSSADAAAARKEANYERALRQRMKRSLSWRLTGPLREIQRVGQQALSRLRRKD